VSLNAHDVPVCLHPSVSVSQLRRIAEDAGVSRHRFLASAYSYDLDASHVSVEACSGCLLDRACRKLPREYIEGDPTTLFRPITASSLRVIVEDTLAAIDPSSEDAVGRLADLTESLELVGQLGDAATPLAPLRGMLREAVDDLMLLAARRRDAPEMLRAFFLRAGLAPHELWFLEESQWSALATPLSTLAMRAGALSPDAAASRPRLRLGGLEIALEGTALDDGRFRIERAAPVLPSPDATLSRLSLAVFLLTVLPAFRPGRELVLGRDRVTLFDEGEGRQVYVALRPDGIAWHRGAPTAPETSLSE
jgi:hypothetical protein